MYFTLHYSPAARLLIFQSSLLAILQDRLAVAHKLRHYIRKRFSVIHESNLIWLQCSLDTVERSS